MQTEILGDKDSDCGTIRTIEVELTAKNIKDFTYRYVKQGNSYVVITPDNQKNFVGKTVHMRSPMYCIGVGKEKCLCNKCAGDFFYKLGKQNIGLVTGKMAGQLSNLNLQKFHDNVVKMVTLDVDKMYF